MFLLPSDWLRLDRILVLAVCLSLVAFTLIHRYPWLRSRPRSPNTKQEPPVLPYWLPYLQHLPWFLWNPGALYHAGKKRFPNGPFTLMLAGTKFHVFDSASTINSIFSRSRKFSFEPVMVSMMENGVDLPRPDQHKFWSSSFLPGQPSFVSANHNIWARSLSGPRLDDIMDIYMKNFDHILALRVPVNSSEWTRVNMHSFLRRLVFETSILTFFGPRLEQLWPTMWDDWRRYDDATYIGVRSRWAYFLQPGAYAARERMFEAFGKWIEAAGEEDWNDANGTWCEQWGFRMNWERDRLAREHHFTFRGRVCLQASFLFVIVTNAAPMASWFTWCAAGTPDRLASYRAAALQVAGHHHGPGRPSLSKFELKSLKEYPYIRGLWLEALRLGTASAAARVILDEDAELEGHLLPKGSVILMPAQLMHLRPEVFAEPLTISPERWTTGNAEQHKRMHNTMRPFGGGTSLCSGRFVAEQEIIGVVTSLVLLFDLKFGEESNMWEFNPRSIGIMGPKRDLILYLRRRSPACD